MRVLFLTHSFPRYRGDMAGSFVLRLATALATHGVVVHVLAPATAGAPARDVIEGIPVSRFRYAPRALETLAYEGTMASQVLTSWKARAGLLGLLGAELGTILDETRREHYDAVHAHWWFPSGLAAMAATRWSGTPLVTTLHGSDVRLGRRVAPARLLMRQTLAASARVTAVSSWLADETQAVSGGERPIVAPMPVDAEFLSMDGTIPRGSSLLFVGRLTMQKGLDFLVRALAMLDRDVTLDVVGDGEERSSLETLSASLELESRVRWHGRKPSSALKAFYRRAAALVVPSADEGLGLVAVEAQLCGTPVIAFASGGIVDVIRDGETGILVPDRTVEALTSAITNILARPDRGASLARSAMHEVRERFSPERVALRYLDIYRQAIAQPIR
jgi:glycosyltransferase involved in cell wall biosynthesis